MHHHAELAFAMLCHLLATMKLMLAVAAAAIVSRSPAKKSVGFGQSTGFFFTVVINWQLPMDCGWPEVQA